MAGSPVFSINYQSINSSETKLSYVVILIQAAGFVGFHILFLLVLDVRYKFFFKARRDKWRWRHTILTFHTTSGENRREKSARFSLVFSKFHQSIKI